MDYRLDTPTWFTAIDEAQIALLHIQRSHKNVSILDFLNANPPEFFFSDFSRLYGSELFPGPGGVAPALRDEQFVTIDWDAEGVDIEREFGTGKNGKLSIHDFLEERLPSVSDIVFYDHKTGEIADFITFQALQNELQISFYHCKGSDTSKPGARVKDYYEVCMQFVKSLVWIENNNRLRLQMDYRELNVGSRYIKGTKEDLKDLLEQFRLVKTTYRLVLVQPGISKSQMDELASLLSDAGDYISKSRGQNFEVWCAS